LRWRQHHPGRRRGRHHHRRSGDDLIDGDAWLNVRISVRANTDGTDADNKVVVKTLGQAV
jgi:hypothetical protein